MRVILDEFDGSFLPILQSFKAVMPNLRITGIEEPGETTNAGANLSAKPREQTDENADEIIKINEFFERREDDDFALGRSLFSRDEAKFDDENEAVNLGQNAKYQSALRTSEAAKFDEAAASEQKNFGRERENLALLEAREDASESETKNGATAPSQTAQTAAPAEKARETSFAKSAQTAASEDLSRADLFDTDETSQNLAPRTETKAATERKKHEMQSLFTDDEVRAILELK